MTEPEPGAPDTDEEAARRLAERMTWEPDQVEITRPEPGR